MLETYLLIHRLQRIQAHASRLLALNVRDFRFLADFYKDTFEPVFGGRVDNIARAPLVRPSLLQATLRALETRVTEICKERAISTYLTSYFRGDGIGDANPPTEEQLRHLAFYLAMERVPCPAELRKLRTLAQMLVDRYNAEHRPTKKPVSEILHVLLRRACEQMQCCAAGDWSSQSAHDVVQAWSM